jgi:hypothetical protein
LKYWEFEPVKEELKGLKAVHRQASDSSDATRVERDTPPPKPKRKWGFRRSKAKQTNNSEHSEEKESVKAPKKMPVILFDEAHKL